MKSVQVIVDTILLLYTKSMHYNSILLLLYMNLIIVLKIVAVLPKCTIFKSVCILCYNILGTLLHILAEHKVQTEEQPLQLPQSSTQWLAQPKGHS